MPKCPNDIELFSISRPADFDLGVTEIVKQMMKEARAIIQKDQIDPTDIYPEITVDVEGENVQLVIYRYVREGIEDGDKDEI